MGDIGLLTQPVAVLKLLVIDWVGIHRPNCEVLFRSAEMVLRRVRASVCFSGATESSGFVAG